MTSITLSNIFWNRLYCNLKSLLQIIFCLHYSMVAQSSLRNTHFYGQKGSHILANQESDQKEPSAESNLI